MVWANQPAIQLCLRTAEFGSRLSTASKALLDFYKALDRYVRPFRATGKGLCVWRDLEEYGSIELLYKYILVTMQIHKFRRDYAVKQQEQVIFSPTVMRAAASSLSTQLACLLTPRFWMSSLL